MKGSCLCGAVRFEISCDIPGLYQCHCSLCRKSTGAGSNAAFIVDSTGFEWLEGTTEITSFVKPTGYRVDFCKHCGSPVPNRLRDLAKIWVPAGLLDEDPMVKVAHHLFVDSKASWDVIGGEGVQHAGTTSEII